jgi:hypothetical protein
MLLKAMIATRAHLDAASATLGTGLLALALLLAGLLLP